MERKREQTKMKWFPFWYSSFLAPNTINDDHTHTRTRDNSIIHAMNVWVYFYLKTGNLGMLLTRIKLLFYVNYRTAFDLTRTRSAREPFGRVSFGGRSPPLGIWY